MVRTANGRFVSPDGFTEGEVKLVKGMIFDVDRLDIRGVIVHHAHRKVMIDKQNVRLFDRLPTLQATVEGFTPGQLVILSAKYTLSGNQPRNVKSRLEKYLPDKGLLTAPLKFLVTDDLSTTAGNQQFVVIPGQATQVIITPGGNGQNRLFVQPGTPSTVIQTSPNVLMVEYSFAGKKIPQSVLRRCRDGATLRHLAHRHFPPGVALLFEKEDFRKAPILGGIAAILSDSNVSGFLRGREHDFRHGTTALTFGSFCP